MSKKTKIIVVSAAVVLIVAAGVFVFFKMKPNLLKNGPSNKTAAQNAALNPLSGQAIGEKLPNTNPFDVKVNPYDAYKNPFK